MDSGDSDDPKVKELLDPATEADLARWFSLPSFQQVAEQPRPQAVVDEEMQAVIERQNRALAAVDPDLVEALRIRHEVKPATVTRFQAIIDVLIDEQFGTLDQAMIDKAGSIADPREVEISEELRDDMKDCAPQALLRDLHRAELDFDKTFEIVDFGAELRVDVAAEVSSAMATSWKLPKAGTPPLAESRQVLAGVRAAQRQPWIDLIPALDNRTVKE